MPPTEVRAFRDAERGGTVPLRVWLDDLRRREPKAHAKCLARILELAQKGNEMRDPHARYLRDGIWELRAKSGRVQYRLLYFFFGKNIVTVSHGIVKEREVPPSEIELAFSRRALVLDSSDKYTAAFEI